jgi:hypothetical protein
MAGWTTLTKAVEILMVIFQERKGGPLSHKFKIGYDGNKEKRKKLWKLMNKNLV